MLVEDTLGRGLMSQKYGHCPLKKRPVLVSREERPETPPTSPPPHTAPTAPPHPAHLATTLRYTPYSYDTMSEEPQNLSTKPEDLSRTGNYPRACASPGAPCAAAAVVKCEPRAWSPLEPPATLLRPAPHYAYLPALYAPYCSGLEELSPAALPPHLYHYSPASPPSSVSPPPCPEDLRSPGSVSSDSGVSVSGAHHSARRPRYQCPDCAKSYSTYSGLTKHTQYHCAAAEGSLARKSFSCKYCAKEYTSLGALKMHIRTHTLPCKCHLCGKAFSRPWLLQGHIRTHTGEKPFSCHHCRRAFADRSNLRAHLQTHSDVKKYSCEGCGKTFSRMSLLTKHAEGGCGAPGAGAGAGGYEYRAEVLPASFSPPHQPHQPPHQPHHHHHHPAPAPAPALPPVHAY